MPGPTTSDRQRGPGLAIYLLFIFQSHLRAKLQSLPSSLICSGNPLFTCKVEPAKLPSKYLASIFLPPIFFPKCLSPGDLRRPAQSVHEVEGSVCNTRLNGKKIWGKKMKGHRMKAERARVSLGPSPARRRSPQDVNLIRVAKQQSHPQSAGQTACAKPESDGGRKSALTRRCVFLY